MPHSSVGKTYRQRREARAERLKDWADKRDVRAEQAHDGAASILGMIPLGQPILLGHHSQRRAERDQERITRGLRASAEHSATAASMRSRAANIEAAAESAIYSDDADAIEQLETRIAGLEDERSAIKAHNAACRKGTADPSTLSAKLQRELANAVKVWGDVQCPGGRFPKYTLENLGSRISKDRKRLAGMRAGA